MPKLNLAQVVKNIQMTTMRHQPEILTGLGIAGMITTTIMAVKATPKALDLIAEVKEKHEEDTDKRAYSKDILVKVAPVYLPSVILGGLSVTCLIGASSVNYKRNAALATAYSLSESALRDYKEKVVETIGEKKEEKIRGAVAQSKVDRNPPVSEKIIFTGGGNDICHETFTGRYFYSDMETLKKATNEINSRLLREDYISLNDFFMEIGLEPVKRGDDLGWRSDRGLIELDLDAAITPEGKPCLVLDFTVAPYYDYY